MKNIAIDLRELPPLHLVLLSHYHEDHFDRMVEDSLNRAFPIITTHHAKDALTRADRGDPFQAVYAPGDFEAIVLRLGPANDQRTAFVIKVTDMPVKHVPPVRFPLLMTSSRPCRRRTAGSWSWAARRRTRATCKRAIASKSQATRSSSTS